MGLELDSRLNSSLQNWEMKRNGQVKKIYLCWHALKAYPSCEQVCINISPGEHIVKLKCNTFILVITLGFMNSELNQFIIQFDNMLWFSVLTWKMFCLKKEKETS